MTILDALIGTLTTLALTTVVTTVYALIVLGLFRVKPLALILFPFHDEMVEAANRLSSRLKSIAKLDEEDLSILRSLAIVSGATVLGVFILLAAVIIA